MNKKILIVLVLGSFFLSPLFTFYRVRAADAPLTFNTESMRPIELRAAAIILLQRLVDLLEARLAERI